MNRSTLLSAFAVSVAVLASTWASGSLSASAQPTAQALEVSSAPLRVTAPPTVYGYYHRGQVSFDPGLRLVAQNSPFELWSTRASYRDLIHTEWRSESGTVALPEGIQTDFDSLSSFIRIEITDLEGNLLRVVRHDACLNGWDTQRISPDAPIRSPYPTGCPHNRYTLGSVQGIQEGWATRLDVWGSEVRLPMGTYQGKVFLGKGWREAMGLAKPDVSTSFSFVVDDEYVGCRGCRTSARPTTGELDGPAASEPTRARAGEPTGPLPDLRSLPAFGIKVVDGNFLAFSANVWNAGDSPLVVDGFRRETEDVMDAYQYFLDANGEQVGYQLVGEMGWDERRGHHHWHFKDFARYRLLDASKVEAVRSRKEAFCLAATDAVDYTVPGADWQPDYTDLHTQCGSEDSLSIREVLSSGSGDTYAQWLAGQSFNLKGLPNGTYYIAVEANPLGNIIEHSTDNNVKLRKVIISGEPGARIVRVPRVGIV